MYWKKPFTADNHNHLSNIRSFSLFPCNVTQVSYVKYNILWHELVVVVLNNLLLTGKQSSENNFIQRYSNLESEARNMSEEAAPLQETYRRQRSAGPTKVSATKKYITFVINVLFWLSGILMVLVGVYSKAAKYNSSLLLSLPWFLDPSNFILGVGAILVFIPFFGCLGSLRENICLLKVFEYTIAALCIVQLALVIFVSVDSERMKRMVSK